MGEVAIIPPKVRGCLGQRLVLLRPERRTVDGRFLLYALMSTAVQAEIHSYDGMGSTVSNLRIPSLEKLTIPLPPLTEQRAIAHILGTLDDKIELNRKMNQTLEEMARTIFKSWFVDFNPVRAKAEGKKPAGMDDATAALFPDGFEDSELGEIPRGWENITLGDRVTFLGGYSFKSKDWTAAGVPVVKIGSVKPGIIDLTQVSYVSPKIAEGASRYRLDTGDLLIGMTGYVGEVGLVPPTKESPLLNQRVGKLVFEDGIQELPFWYCVTRPEISDLFDRGS